MALITVVAALAPVFAVILLGFVFKQRRLVADAFWPPAERATFYIFFPSLLVISIARAELGGASVGPMLAGSLLPILAVVAGCFALRRVLRLGGPAFTSLIQSSVRPNVYVALAAAAALYGSAGVALMSLCIAVIVPTVNVISIIALVRYASAGGGLVHWRRTVVPVITNPLILACGAGLVLNATGVRLPPLIGPTLEILAQASLPVGLLAVGAGLQFQALRVTGSTVAVASVLKLAVLPVLTLILAEVLGAEALARNVAVLVASVPVSASAYVMAREMGGDPAIMAGAITATTMLAAASMPLVLALVVAIL
jgi:malonate transporter and related proteins